jgi:hypothetical protein
LPVSGPLARDITVQVIRAQCAGPACGMATARQDPGLGPCLGWGPPVKPGPLAGGHGLQNVLQKTQSRLLSQGRQGRRPVLNLLGRCDRAMGCPAPLVFWCGSERERESYPIWGLDRSIPSNVCSCISWRARLGCALDSRGSGPALRRRHQSESRVGPRVTARDPGGRPGELSGGFGSGQVLRNHVALSGRDTTPPARVSPALW